MIMPEILIKTIAKEGALIPCPPPLPAPPPLPPPPPPPPPPKKKQIWILCQNSLTRELKIRVVGFVLKKILTYFEMLIVPHALHCVDSCIFVFTSFDTVCCFGFSARPPSPFPQIFFIRFSFFVKFHLLESSQSCRVTLPPPTPSFPQFFFYQI